MKRVVRALSVLSLWLPFSGAAGAAEVAPPGVNVRFTYVGPVYVHNGMTLYSAPDLDEAGKPSKCGDEDIRRWQRAIQRIDFPLPYEAGERIPCVKRWPPFTASDNDKPVGQWTIVKRPDGALQWSFKGLPVYTSVRDTRAGDVNGKNQTVTGRNSDPWVPLDAPFFAPDGMKTATLDHAYVLADSKDRYVLTNVDAAGKPLPCPKDCSGKVTALTAPPLAKPFGNWTIVESEKAGVKQWAYKGQPLFRAATGIDASQVSGHRMVEIYTLPKVPSSLAVRTGPEGPMVTDKAGMTMYYFLCKDGTEQGLSCDAPGDTPLYYYSVCGGAATCLEKFKYVIAPAGAEKEENELWTVRSIDVKNPMRVLGQGEEGTRVWQYRDHPVFLFTEDLAPGDFWGVGDMIFAWATLQLVPATLDVDSH